MTSTSTRDREIIKSEVEWRSQLTPERYRVTRQHGTERAVSALYWNEKRPVQYSCIGCDALLFSSKTKYDSGTGWPSFWSPVGPNAVSEHGDWTWFMRRTEVRCASCDAHIGHVFADGPRPTGRRCCVNGTALRFVPGGKV